MHLATSVICCYLESPVLSSFSSELLELLSLSELGSYDGLVFVICIQVHKTLCMCIVQSIFYSLLLGSGSIQCVQHELVSTATYPDFSTSSHYPLVLVILSKVLCYICSTQRQASTVMWCHTSLYSLGLVDGILCTLLRLINSM